MGWWNIQIRPEEKTKGDKVKQKAELEGKKLTHSDIYGKGLEKLAEEMELEIKEEKERDVMDLF